MNNTDVAEMLAFINEAQACGAVCAELVMPWTEEFARLDGLTMPQHPSCVACESCRPDIPAAIIDIYAAESPTMHMPVPVCEACWAKGRKRLMIRTQKVIRKVLPDVLIHFVGEE
jgi:NAD-dependent dihydropyrimidine dehydrogenase PreA subunit